MQDHYQHDCIELVNVSSFLETLPHGVDDQPNFLNCACEISTILSPEELLVVTQDIEKDCDRTSKGTMDPRTLDIDILFYDRVIISTSELMIPHPLLHEREFVLRPLAEIAPNFVHPIIEESIQSLVSQLEGY